MEKCGEVKLIGAWASPFVLRVRIALSLKHVDYELFEEDLPFKKSQLLLDSNPVHKKVPVLLHHGKPICESLIIVQYIDEVWASSGVPILPHDPHDRAIVRFWASYIDEKLFPSMRGLMTTEDEAQRKVLIEQAFAGFELLEEALGKCGKGGKFFGGETIGFLDIVLGSVLGWLRVMERAVGLKLLDRNPKLEAWSASFCESEFVKELMPETDKLAEFGKLIQERMRPAAAAASAAATPPSS